MNCDGFTGPSVLIKSRAVVHSYCFLPSCKRHSGDHHNPPYSNRPLSLCIVHKHRCKSIVHAALLRPRLIQSGETEPARCFVTDSPFEFRNADAQHNLVYIQRWRTHVHRQRQPAGARMIMQSHVDEQAPADNSSTCAQQPITGCKTVGARL